MRNKAFIHDFLFRLSFPLLWSVMTYVLILLIFGDINNFTEIYTIKEQSLCLFISFVLFEFLRYFNVLTEKFIGNQQHKLFWWFASIPVSLILCFIIIYIILYFYFTKYIGYTVYKQELYFFSIIYLFSSLFYNLLYISIYFQGKQNKLLIEKECNKHKNTILEIENMINQVNTSFLFQSLELISIKSVHHPKEAENIINKISTIYRYRFEHNNNKILLSKEIEIIKEYINIFNINTKDSIILNIENNIDTDNITIPHEILLNYIENLVNNYITTNEIPLIIDIIIKNNNVTIINNKNPEKVLSKNIDNTIENWIAKYKYQYNIDIISNINTQNIETIINFII